MFGEFDGFEGAGLPRCEAAEALLESVDFPCEVCGVLSVSEFGEFSSLFWGEGT